MVVFGYKWFYSNEKVVFGEKWLYSGKMVVFGQRLFYSGKSGFIQAEMVVFVQSDCIRENLFYSRKMVEFVQT